MTPLISVIVPVYNVEQYLKECVDSILMQTMKDFEVILVDDGSLDKSGAICDDYSKRFENVVAFHKENGGLSDARNFGIKKAKGKYLVFIDSDDYYDDNDFFEKIKKATQDYNCPEIIGYSYKKHFISTNRFCDGEIVRNVEEINDILSYNDLMQHLIANNALIISACAKAIKRTFVIDNDLFFKKGIFCEDIEWSMRVYSNSINMKFINSDAYVYRCGRINSITNTIGVKNLNDLIDIIEENSKKFLNTEDLLSELLLSYLAYQYCILCGLVTRLKTKEEIVKIRSFIFSYQWLLNYSLNPKVKKVLTMKRFFGIRITVFALGFYLKHRRN